MIQIPEYTGPTRTQLLTAHGFKLIDLDKGFEPENRQELFEIPHSLQTPAQVKIMIEDKLKCDPMVPLSYYNPEMTFYELQMIASDYAKEHFNDIGIPHHLMKQRFSKMTPEELADFYAQQPVNIEQFVEQSNMKSNDPDNEYFNFVGTEFIDADTRRKLEHETPFLYIWYSISEVNGCEHYYRDAFPICAHCNRIYPCRFCHDDEVFDHKMDRKLYTQMYCLFCKKIGKIGKYCEHCQQKVSDICCETCHTLCQIPQSVKPAYHCDSCGLCRVGFQKHSTHCYKCNTCYDIRQPDEHVCQEDLQCCVCTASVIESITPEFRLKCNSRHRIHASCYDSILQSGSFFCPLDHKIIIDDDQYAMLRGKVYHLYRNQTIDYFTSEQYVSLRIYRCYDCGQYGVDFILMNIPAICQGCLGVNCSDRGEVSLQIGEFLKYQGIVIETQEYDKYLKEMNEMKENYPKQKIAEFVMKFRSINSKIIPKFKKLADSDIFRLFSQIFGFPPHMDFQNADQ